jgi:hypothetical protein
MKWNVNWLRRRLSEIVSSRGIYYTYFKKLEKMAVQLAGHCNSQVLKEERCPKLYFQRSGRT